jgi:hypothetical protein
MTELREGDADATPRKWHHGATAARAWAKPAGTEGGPWAIRRRKGILA